MQDKNKKTSRFDWLKLQKFNPLRTLPRRISGNTIAFGLAGIFVSTFIAAAHIIYHSGADAVGIYRPLRTVFVFFAGSKQACCCHSRHYTLYHVKGKTIIGPVLEDAVLTYPA
jgi:hypothetical protein